MYHCIIYLKNIYFDINAYTNKQMCVQFLFTTGNNIEHRDRRSIIIILASSRGIYTSFYMLKSQNITYKWQCL